jgi:hypothetical protein
VVKRLEAETGCDRLEDVLELAFESLVGGTGIRDHVQDSIPDLVEAVVTELPSLAEPVLRHLQHDGSHLVELTRRVHAQRICTDGATRKPSMIHARLSGLSGSRTVSGRDPVAT